MPRSRVIPAFLLMLLPLAAETKVRIEGINSISESDVLALVAGRLEWVRTQPAAPSRAADAAFLVEQIFRNNGFSEAEVSWRILAADQIRLTITEGPRQLLGEVEIDGVADRRLARNLQNLFGLPASRRPVRAGGKAPFLEGDVEEGLTLMKSQLQSQGFWSPELAVTERETDPATGAIRFRIRVDAGPVHQIAEPRFDGDRPAGLESVTTGFVGSPATTANVNGLRLAVTDYYRSRGFVEAQVGMSIIPEGGLFVPTFTITQGTRFRLGEVTFEGLEKTNPARIAGRLDGLRGEFIDGNVVDRRIRQIIATGAFSSVRTETTPRGDDVLDATLRFEEGEARGISFSLGADSFEGVIAGVSYFDRNFRGQLRNFNAGFEVTARTILGEVSLADPWLFGSENLGRARLYANTRNLEGYKTWRAGLEGSLSRQVNDHYKIDLSLGWAYVNTSPDGLLPTDLGETVYQNPYLTFNQRFEHRDNPVLPSTGWHLDLPLEIGATIGDLSANYVKTGFAGSWHHPLGKSGQLAFGLRGGVLVPDDSTALPIDLRYFNGGARSVRSFAERELGPRSVTGYPLGGEAYWVSNLEYIRPIAGSLKGVLFLDAGGLSSDWEDLGVDQTNVALGLGIRLDLPIGPVRLEYGHNLTREYGQSGGAWHFAIGTAF